MAVDGQTALAAAENHDGPVVRPKIKTDASAGDVVISVQMDCRSPLPAHLWEMPLRLGIT